MSDPASVPSLGTSSLTRRDHLRAAVVLGVGLVLLLAAPPGCDFVSLGDLRAAQRSMAPGSLSQGGLAMLLWTEATRRDLVAGLKPLERTFRISQTWSLYRDGPASVLRLEVQVDGVVVYRTGDAHAAWRAAQLGNRRSRPMVETVVGDPRARNWEGIGRFLVTQARADFPTAQEIRLVATRARFGEAVAHPTHARVARTPDWTLRVEAP